MNELLNEIKEWSEEVKYTSIVKWDLLPDIELYMDQVITYIEKQLQIFRQDEEDSKLITSSMINNYVKDGVIKHAVQKKYSKEHLAPLLMLGLFKQVLPIPLIGKLIGIFNGSADKKSIYDLFINIQKESLNTVLKRLDGEIGGKEDLPSEDLYLIALTLSCDAFANRIAAERIFKLIEVNNNSGEAKENAVQEPKKKSENEKKSKEQKK